MPPVVLENPILNSPYREPARHFRFDANNEITNVIDSGRRASSYFLPIAAPKKRGVPGLFDDDHAGEKKAESDHVNRIRQLMKKWRGEGWPAVTPSSRTLLDLLGVSATVYLPMLLGAQPLRRGEASGMGRAAAVLAKLPCSPAFLIGLPVGIWANIVPHAADVKALGRDRHDREL